MKTNNDIDLLKLRFNREVLHKSGMTWSDVAKHDPQEMAVFCFLVGAGMTWDEARMADNLVFEKLQKLGDDGRDYRLF